ncbi:epsin, putative [Plasmodium chabaudi chabaudi]|uniref:Epsin, putative n=1 Tax=Plasmodium chabaudi chabaudi TaxID=31271 RepID=A0A1C6YU43_PLACU|nr:epsin, putative [Plasmodium chabaudi chabaudi]
MLLFKKVNSKVSSINNYLQKYLESNQFEKNLKEALNNKNYGVSNSLLYDLSISTYDATYYKRVIREVFKAIQEKPSKWRRIYKGLRLCEYVMKNGCEYFISDVKEKEELIKKLAHFTYLENLRDKGIGIREISNNILKLLRDNKYLRNERIEAAKYANLCTNIESKVVEKKSFFLNKKKKKGKTQDENNKKSYFKFGNNNKYGPHKDSLDQIKYERYDFKRYENDDDYYSNNYTGTSQYRNRNYNRNSGDYSQKSSVDSETDNSSESSNESSSKSSSSESSSDNSSDNESSNYKSRRNISKRKSKKKNNLYSKRSKDMRSSSRSKSQSVSSRSNSKQSDNNSSAEDSSTSSDSSSKSRSSSSSNDSSNKSSDSEDSSYYSRRRPRQTDKGDKTRNWKREVSDRIR